MKNYNKDETKLMTIEQPIEEMYIIPEQSADTLFNYMNKIEYLMQILNQKRINPRYNIESIDYLNIGFKQIAFPQTCFCDINLHNIEPHTKKYGKYGIAFYKKWCINIGIQPIHYINKKSVASDDFRIAFNAAINSQSNDKAFLYTRNSLLTHLFFMKPLMGTMKKNNVESEVNFHDEKEWRYIPRLNVKGNRLPPQVLLDKDANNTACNTYSELLKSKRRFSLKFDYENIKYLIVPDKKDKKILINYIESKKVNAKKEIKLDLISKILVLDEIKKDW